MIKKFISYSASMFLALTACSTENTVAPSNGPVKVTQNECSAKLLSQNSVELKTAIANAFITTATAKKLKGNKVELEITTLYDESVPVTEIQKTCTENKMEAAEKNATVSCTDYSITVKSIEKSYMNIDQTLASAQQACKEFSKKYSSVSSEDPNPGQIENDPPTPPPSTKTGKATCQILEDSENNFSMIVSAPDSVTITGTASFNNGVQIIKLVEEFDPSVPQSVIDAECASAKEEIAEEEGIPLQVSCEGNKITGYFEAVTGKNMMTSVVPLMISECNQIQETGIIPDDF